MGCRSLGISYRFRPALDKLKPYVAGRGIGEIARQYSIPADKIVKLGSNENPYGPSPGVKEAISSVPLHLYPETDELLQALASYTGFSRDMIVVGTGMDGVLDTLSRLFLEEGRSSAISTPTFSYYEILTRLAGAKPVLIPRDEDFRIDPDSLTGVDGSSMIFLCSPNNPTSNASTEEEVRAVVESTGAMVFLDEAYVDFAKKSLISMVSRYDNLIVGRTMSKAFGLAGLRLGYAVLPAPVADQYRRAAPPFFGLSTISVAAGVAALQDAAYMRRSVEKIRKERQRLISELPEAGPSQANFLYLETDRPSSEVAEALLRQGVIVRDCRSFWGAGENHIRVTVGTREQNDRFLEAYRRLC
ncbi:MAG TPA: histidinol-phosphate transaminase [Methanotrichaceae archaeon]|mgnify:CR=1 FL=1|nr:histidinol-phosphate transaminase [Methanotrichaceae archaeon]HQF16114.1 histidinol-phosphate transaminase [Methanotrichaceae archaeon]HQI90772.1 histidinol-phosphate transaminase [Methanotrichaceae archaeon]HQJ28272.1 histidinol-phosphate transaminase [Methanotrichaceae archaeon]